MLKVRRLLLCSSCCLVGALVACALPPSSSAAAAEAAAAAAAAEAAAAEAAAAEAAPSHWALDNGALRYEDRTRTETEDSLLFGEGTNTASDDSPLFYPPDAETLSDEIGETSRMQQRQQKQRQQKQQKQKQKQQREEALKAAIAAASAAAAALLEGETQAIEYAFMRARGMIAAHRFWLRQRVCTLIISAFLSVYYLFFSGLSRFTSVAYGLTMLLFTFLFGMRAVAHYIVLKANEKRLNKLQAAYQSGKLNADKHLLMKDLNDLLALPNDIQQQQQLRQQQQLQQQQQQLRQQQQLQQQQQQLQ
ncbi:hypothetical protein Emed_002533 [Eimeria media]